MSIATGLRKQTVIQAVRAGTQEQEMLERLIPHIAKLPPETPPIGLRQLAITYLNGGTHPLIGPVPIPKKRSEVVIN